MAVCGGNSISCCLSIDDFNEVATACERISYGWEELAKHLNIDRVIVLSIQRERGGESVISCLNKLLTVWLRQPSPTQPKPTWNILCKAVSKMDRPLAECIWTKHVSECGLCCSAAAFVSDFDTRQQQQQSIGIVTPLHTLKNTPVAKAVQQKNAVEAAKELKKDFKELMQFLITEISTINVDQLRYAISDYFQEDEESIDQVLEDHLTKIEDCKTPSAILNYFRRYNLIGYINYSFVKVFQQQIKSPLLDKRIEKYEENYQCFLELSLSQIHDAFQQCSDLRPDYPAGMPKFTIYLQSEWEGKSMLDLKEFLKQCVTNSDCIDQLMIAKIIRNCIIITFAVPPHIARKVLEYLTDNDVVMSMKKEGISVDISEQLLKYNKDLKQTSDALPALKTDSALPSYNSQDFQLVKLEEYHVIRKQTDEKLQLQITLLEKELVNQKMMKRMMMMELDNTRDELRKTKHALSIANQEVERLSDMNNISHHDQLDEIEQQTDEANISQKSTKSDGRLKRSLKRFFRTSKANQEDKNEIVTLKIGDGIDINLDVQEMNKTNKNMEEFFRKIDLIISTLVDKVDETGKERLSAEIKTDVGELKGIIDNWVKDKNKTSNKTKVDFSGESPPPYCSSNDQGINPEEYGPLPRIH